MTHRRRSDMDDSKLTEKITEKLAEKVIEDYIKRMVKNCKTKKGVSTDKQIDCPKCGIRRGMEFRGLIWKCLVVQCKYKFPKKITPPSPDEIEEIMKLKGRINFIKKYERLLD